MRDAADDIKDIEKQERTEKELRVAEMETNKAMCVKQKSSSGQGEVTIFDSQFHAAGIC